jgi:hypothetical protein
MTPEGLNARLTFLNQCVRPGDTLPIKGISDVSDLNARNTTFGPPPICVLRIGDFYHSKIIVRDVNITFEDNVWDLNPEGIGVQPMIANVQMQVNFIGGHGLEKPVERLQNALSSNFYANTEMYDPRSQATEDRSQFYKQNFTKEFLDSINKEVNLTAVANSDDALTAANKIVEGTYIGTLNGTALEYTTLIDELFDNTESYFEKLANAYNLILNLYDVKLSSIILSPIYRTIHDYTVETGSGQETIELLGEYPSNFELEVLTSDFERQMLDKLDVENVSTIFGLDKDLTASEMIKSEDIIKPEVETIVSEMIDGMTKFKSIKEAAEFRNKIIVVLDKLNFINGEIHDGKVDTKKEEYIGVNFNGFSSSELYGTYNNVIEFIKDNSDKFSEDLNDSFTFGRNAIITTNDLSYFLSVLLKNDTVRLMKVYQKYTKDFSIRTLTNIEKRLNKFMAGYPSEKDFNLKYPKRKDGNSISFDILDETYVFNDSQIDVLLKVYRTGNYKTTSVLNYYRK